MHCTHCGSQNIRQVGLNRIIPLYKCLDCGRRFTGNDKGNPNWKKSPSIIYPICPYCGSEKTVRNGYLPSGVQRYLCQQCKKSFNDKWNKD